MEAVMLIPKGRDAAVPHTETTYDVFWSFPWTTEGYTGFKGSLSKEGPTGDDHHAHKGTLQMIAYCNALLSAEETTRNFAVEPYHSGRPRRRRPRRSAQRRARPDCRRSQRRETETVCRSLALTSASNAECCACNPGRTTTRQPRHRSPAVPPLRQRAPPGLAVRAASLNPLYARSEPWTPCTTTMLMTSQLPAAAI